MSSQPVTVNSNAIPTPVVLSPAVTIPVPISSSMPVTAAVPPAPSKVNYTPNAPDIASVVDITSNCSTDRGLKTIIEVIPDARVILKAIIFHVAPMYAEMSLKDTPHGSPLSIIGYLMFAIHAYMLHNDHLARRPRSDYADKFMTKPINADLFNILLQMKVPPFMKTILTGLVPTTDPRRTNFSYVSSFASFSFMHDYPRIIPPSLFITGHNLVSTLSARSQPTEVRNNFHGSTLVTYEGTALNIGNFLGTNIARVTSGTTYNDKFINWLNQTVLEIFNPVVMRSLQNRAFFAPINFLPPTFTANDINPYSYLLVADIENIESTTSFIQTMSSMFTSHLPGCSTLADVISSLSGNAIVTHSVSIIPLPTWTNKTTTTKDSTAAETQRTKTDFANEIKYLAAKIIPTTRTGNLFTFPTSTDGTAVDNLVTSFYDIANVNYNIATDTTPILTFNLEDHVSPRVRLFDPYETSISKLLFTVISGLKIESFEIDSVSVPLPNSDLALSTENSFFLQSALPLSAVHDANDPICGIIARKITSSINQPVSFGLYDLTLNNLRPMARNSPGAVPANRAPFTKTDVPTNDLIDVFSHFGFNIGTSPPIGIKKFHLWSSYRYIHSRNGDLNDRIFMLSTLRSIYGTNPTFVETKYPPTLIII